jgi:hypothetical protein
VSTTEYTELALQGVSEIASGTLRGGLQFTPAVKAAIEAGLAVDADPYFAMSDMLIGPSARLTDAGRAVAHDQTLLVLCACPGCNREVNPATARDGYCDNCLRTGNQRTSSGRWGGWINGNQCYDHYLFARPEVQAERSRLLRENTQTSRRRGYSYEKQRAYEQALGYIDPADVRSEEPKGTDWHYDEHGQAIWNDGRPIFQIRP